MCVGVKGTGWITLVEGSWVRAQSQQHLQMPTIFTIWQFNDSSFVLIRSL